LKKLGIISDDTKIVADTVAVNDSKKDSENEMDNHKMICPFCNQKELISQENCLKCLSCGYSKCG